VSSGKTWRSLFLFLGGILGGALIGYFAAWGRIQGVSNETFLAWQHMASQRGAEAHLLFLEAMDSGRTNDFRKLRLKGQASLAVYVADVNQIKKQHGYSWCPNDPGIYQRAQKYLADHPSRATNRSPELQK